jgi:hypothetical protein
MKEYVLTGEKMRDWGDDYDNGLMTYTGEEGYDP